MSGFGAIEQCALHGRHPSSMKKYDHNGHDSPGRPRQLSRNDAAPQSVRQALHVGQLSTAARLKKQQGIKSRSTKATGSLSSCLRMGTERGPELSFEIALSCAAKEDSDHLGQ